VPEQSPEDFVREVRHPLAGSLALYCGDAAVAEELAQEALAKAWLRWGRLDDPKAWDGDRLYLDPATSGSITVLHRTDDAEPRPALVLHALRDGVGIEDWTDLPVDDEAQEAAAEVGWDSGDTITVRVTALTVAEPVDLSVADVVLGGRTALVGGVLTFDCGEDRFVISGADRLPLLDVGHILLDTLRCEATPPA
jgi:hypothetical protein